MSSSVRHRFKFLLPWLMLFGLLLDAAPAQAQLITCSSVSMTNLSFGNVNPLSSQADVTATLNYTCASKDNGHTYSALLCFSINEPGGGQMSPRLMTSGSNTLQFQMYQDPAGTTIWGSQFSGSSTPLKVPITIPRQGGNFIGSATLYGRVLGGQTGAIPGSYQNVYQSGNTVLTINDQQSDTAPTNCSTTSAGSFPFTASATVTQNCTVAAGISPINLGTVAPTATNVSGNTSISVTCPVGTAYYVGLAPSNGSTTGAGVMSGTGGNSDKVPYQLYSNAGLTTTWGNTATSTSVGNGVAGIGSGIAQSTPVYARVPGADFQPDNYTDTVTVNVNY